MHALINSNIQTMIFRYPVILALTIAMAAMHDAQGQLIRGDGQCKDDGVSKDHSLYITIYESMHLLMMRLYHQR